MNELEIYGTKRVEYSTRIYFTPPFSLTADDMAGSFEFDWAPSIGEYAHIEVEMDALNTIIANYEIDLPVNMGRDSMVPVYRDENCIMYVWKHAHGLQGEIWVPLQDEWEEDHEDMEFTIE